MKFNFASVVAMSICVSCAFAKDEPIQEVSTLINRMPDSAASLYRQGEFTMGPSWQGLRKLEDSAVFLHRDARRPDKDAAYVWVDKEFVHPGFYEKEKPYLSMRNRVLIDCAGMRSGVAESAYYQRRFGEGEAFARVLQKPDMTDILPDSMEEQMHRIACAPKEGAKLATKAEKKADAKDHPKAAPVSAVTTPPKEASKPQQDQAPRT
jgi:hypothetical protein